MLGGGCKDLQGIGGERIDRDRGGRQRDAWRAVREALGAGGVGNVERSLACGSDERDAAVEDVGRGEEREARSRRRPSASLRAW